MASQTYLAQKIVAYIHGNGPQSYDKLHARAKGHDWYNRDLFDKLMIRVGKYDTISVTKDLVYSRHEPRVRELPVILGPIKNYPEMIEGVNDGMHEIFEALCFCRLFAKPDDEVEHHCIMYGDGERRKTV